MGGEEFAERRREGASKIVAQLGKEAARIRGDDAAAEADDAEEDEPARVERRERRPVDELIVA